MTDMESGTAIAKADVANPTADPVLAEYATEIRRLGKRVKEDVIEIGRILDQAQEHAGRGAWHLWVNAEFGWSDQTAYRFIHLYQAQLNLDFHKLWNSDLPLSGLYQLAALKTPATARNEIAERLEAGEDVSFAVVTEAIGRHKAADSAEKSESSNATTSSFSGIGRPARKRSSPAIMPTMMVKTTMTIMLTIVASTNMPIAMVMTNRSRRPSR
jgi:hypothetical protein